MARVGVSASNVSDSGSDARLAYELVLARTDEALRSPKHSRESMPEFKQDWQNLQAS